MKHLKSESYSHVYASPTAPLSMIRLAYKLIDLLPHGSGIDADWHINVHENFVECCNSLHAMDEFGGYAGWYDFTVEFGPDDIERIKKDAYYVDAVVMEAYIETYDANIDEINPWYAEEEEEEYV